MLEDIRLFFVRKTYVRAFTPLFGFGNLFELQAFDIEDSMPVFLSKGFAYDVNPALKYPVKLKNGNPVPGQNIGKFQKAFYTFDAIQGVNYTLDVDGAVSPCAYLTLYGRDGKTKLKKLHYEDNQHIDWVCPVSGRYYVKVAIGDPMAETLTYNVLMTSNFDSPVADIASADWVGVKDGKVDHYDLIAFIASWANSCSAPYWCNEADFDENGLIDFADFATLAKTWQE